MLNFIYLINFLECGHFCINYVLKKEKIKKKVVYSKQSMSLGLVKRVMQEYFFNVNCLKVDKVDYLDKMGHVITLIKVRKKFLHYIVIKKIENNHIYYYDPAFVNIKKISIDKFYQKWSHYCCVLNQKK